MKKGYIYLGEMFDSLGREINISDKKIGLSIDPIKREMQLNRTKSPIGYRIIICYLVDDMDRVEKMLHAILDSRRTQGEWFKDDEDTLTSEFINFMEAYGAEKFDIIEEKEKKQTQTDTRLVELANKLGKTTLIRRYKGIDYKVVLEQDGVLTFENQKFDTPNKLYNNGIVYFVTGKKGNSGTNQLSQFIIESTGERLKD